MANPLTEEHLEEIKTAIKAADDAQHDIARAEAAGLDVSAQKTAIADGADRLRKIKQAYFPNK